MRYIKIVDLLEAAKRSRLGLEGFANLVYADGGELKLSDFIIQVGTAISNIKARTDIEEHLRGEEKRIRQAKVVSDHMVRLDSRALYKEG
ncbi:hypothetical protein D3C71_1571020 [compost metagenome]